VSKNVAVFVDVANIFYAAKAAGVDIDYVTLLKTATAGRDFVRAYAYTGLDPENENQRQFHSFLARSGYKVVSKDIRKYGDGKVKANLDIELVVDMMRTAQNLDIAVVVSGDGDFAPAIRAVQQMGVRVEVISFRGNTSSDLMDVADTFIDITQIAKVEKDSSRSGRRVAAADDLSMTEVPDKESEGAPRRRRGGRTRTAEPVEAPAEGGRRTATGTELLVLPGEKLSRSAVARAAASAPVEAALPIAADAHDAPEADEADRPEGTDAEESGAEGEAAGHRRRRRRGGRGRGRGRGVEPGAVPGTVTEAEPHEEDEGVSYEAPRVPQHGAFGSVWDSQLGMTPPSTPTSAPAATGGVVSDDETYDDEPEIPEYLLAERRQQAGRPGGGRGPLPAGGRGGRGGRGGGRGGAYQVALDRERYGRGGSSGGSGGSGGSTFSAPAPRRDGGMRPDRGARPSRPPAREAPAPTGGGEPWSEVPPELEEMLRAELARKAPSMQPRVSAPIAAMEVTPAAAAPRRRTTRKPAALQSAEVAEAAAAPSGSEAAAPKRRVTRKVAAPAATSEPAPEPTPAAPKRRVTRKASPTEA
jgi:uncharacterized LabA/DUF88 family protein